MRKQYNQLLQNQLFRPRFHGLSFHHDYDDTALARQSPAEL
jgi:hypothetical protein